MSHASMGANTIINLLKPNKILMFAEGLNIFRMLVVQPLEGKSLADSQIRKETGCNVIAIRRKNNLKIGPDPDLRLENGDEMVLIGTGDAEKRLLALY